MAIPSLMQNSFIDVYDEFLFACSHGDCLTIERLLGSGAIRRHQVSVPIGEEKRSAVVVAIEHNQVEVMKILLNYLPYEDFRECLLLAIYLDLKTIAQLIMEHNTFKCFYGTYADWQRDTVDAYDDSHFEGMRPIHLAAQCNRITILYEFLKLGERIEVPHPIQCQCNPCISAGLTDSLRYSQLRLATYRALSSEIYLALVSPDPIASAFQLSTELRQMIKNEANLSAEYLSLFEQVSSFTARLLNHLQSQKEAEILLTVERIESALKHRQKKFIVHTATQQFLTHRLYDRSGLAEGQTVQRKCFIFFCYLVFFLPMYLANFWFPTIFGKYCHWFFEQPVIAIFFHACFYNCFLILLLITHIHKPKRISLLEEYPEIYNYSMKYLFTDGDKMINIQKEILSPARILVFIWMFGYIFRNIRRMLRNRRFEWMESLISGSYLLYLIFFFSTTIEFYIDWKYILDEERWMTLAEFGMSNSTSAEYQNIKDHMLAKINYLSRQSYASVADLQRSTDALFSICMVLSVIHSCIFFFDIRYVGPLIVSLLITSRIIGRIFVYFLIAVIAYDVSSLHLFSPYMNGSPYGAETNGTARAAISRSFDHGYRLTIYIFFSLFGIAQNELTKNKVSVDGKEAPSVNDPVNYYVLNPFTSAVGSVAYGQFAFLTRIVYLTIVIAYTKRVYGVSLQQATENWFYTRTKIIMNFISQDMGLLPVPLNIIPTPRHLLDLFSRKPPAKSVGESEPSSKLFLRKLQIDFMEEPQSTPNTVEEVFDRLVFRLLAEYQPSDAVSQRRQRKIQSREQLAATRQTIFAEIQLIQQANQALKKHIGTVFFDLK